MNNEQEFESICDECGQKTIVRMWRETHYRLCLQCAIKWSRDAVLMEKLTDE